MSWYCSNLVSYVAITVIITILICKYADTVVTAVVLDVDVPRLCCCSVALYPTVAIIAVEQQPDSVEALPSRLQHAVHRATCTAAGDTAAALAARGRTAHRETSK